MKALAARRRCRRGRSRQALGYLIQRGADVDACDNEGRSPAHIASQRPGHAWALKHMGLRMGCCGALRMLVDAGANLQRADREGCFGPR